MSKQKREYKVAVLPGDGIGQEVASAAITLLESIGSVVDRKFTIDSLPCGGQYYLEHDKDWPADGESRCRNADVILLGAVGWPAKDGQGPVTMTNGKMAGYSAVIGNRVGLDLYANIRPVKLLPGVQHVISGGRSHVWQSQNVDMVILRENTEGLYASMGGTLSRRGKGDIATDTRVITRYASERIIRRAFAIAQDRNGAPADGKKRVTCIAKNNVLDGCRLFVQIFREIAAEFSHIEAEVAIVDAFTQWLVTDPGRYDVCVTTNMFGDIVTDLASVLQGGMGMAVGCNVGDSHAMFEPIHGSAPPLAGKNTANPMAMFLATAEALRWLGAQKQDTVLVDAAFAIDKTIAQICLAGGPLTPDLNPTDPRHQSEVVETVVKQTKALLLPTGH